jgi:hypothetical protein
MFNDASTQHATIPNIGSRSVFTVEAWCRIGETFPNPNTTYTAVVCNEYTGVSNFCIGTIGNVNNEITFGFFVSGDWTRVTGFVPTLNTWYHLVGTYDGATLKFYVNNVLNSQFSYSGTPTSSGGIRIARRWDSGESSSNCLKGDVSVVRIYNRALDATEVSQNYNVDAARFGLGLNVSTDVLYNFRTTSIVSNQITNTGTNSSIGAATITTGTASVVNGGSVQLTDSVLSKIVTPTATGIKSVSMWFRIDVRDTNRGGQFIFDFRPTTANGWLYYGAPTSGGSLDNADLYIDGAFKATLTTASSMTNSVYLPATDSQFHLVTIVLPDASPISGSFTFCNRHTSTGADGIIGYVGGILMHSTRLSQANITSIYNYFTT